MEKQYNFHNSEVGLLAWDVERLIELTKNHSVKEVPLDTICEFDDVYWYGLGEENGDERPTCRNIAEHALQINNTDLKYPIILSASGRVMDGMHRICKAYIEGKSTINAVQFSEDPRPDFVGKNPNELPY